VLVLNRQVHAEGMHILRYPAKLFEVKIGWRGLKTGMKQLTGDFAWDDERLANQLMTASAIRLKIKGVRKSDGKYQYRQLKSCLDTFYHFMEDRIERKSLRRLEIEVSLSGPPYGRASGMEVNDEGEVKGLLRQFRLLRKLENVTIQIKGGKFTVQKIGLGNALTASRHGTQALISGLLENHSHNDDNR
jgi:hypothetical protein